FADASEMGRLDAINQQLIALVRRKKITLGYLEEFIDLNVKFHAEILRLANCRMLDRAMEHISSLPFASSSAFVMRQYLAAESRGAEPGELSGIAVDQHPGIWEAIGNGEASRAEPLRREHPRAARRNLETALKTGEIAKFLPGMKLVRL